MSGALRRLLPKEIIEGSVIFPLFAAYSRVVRELEQRTGHSQTRVMILILFRNGATYNQNQLALALDSDRTVVHRVVKTMLREGYLAEKREPGRKAIELRLTEKGEKERLRIVQVRRELDRQLIAQFSKKETRRVIETLTAIDEIELREAPADP